MTSTRILGVTGGIGCGKSVVCAHLAQLGAEIFDADLTARNLMESDEKGTPGGNQGIWERKLSGGWIFEPEMVGESSLC